MVEEEYFSLDDVLKELSLDEDDVQKMVSEGELTAYKDDKKKMRFKKSDVNKIKQGSTDPTVILPIDDSPTSDTISLDDSTSDLSNDTIGLDFADILDTTDTVELGTSEITEDMAQTDELLLEEESAADTVISPIGNAGENINTETIEIEGATEDLEPTIVEEASDATIVEAGVEELKEVVKKRPSSSKSKARFSSRGSKKLAVAPATKIDGTAPRPSGMMPMPMYKKEKHPILNVVIVLTLLLMFFSGLFYVDFVKHKLRNEPFFKPGGTTGSITSIYLSIFGPEEQKNHWDKIIADRKNLKEQEK